MLSAIQILLKTVTKVQGVLSNPLPEVDAVSFGDSSIDLMVRYWTLPQKVQVRQTKTRVIIALKEACKQANISIPYPIRTYYYKQVQEGDRFPASVSNDST
jgi:small-conductance mechanosensitive channel